MSKRYQCVKLEAVNRRRDTIMAKGRMSVMVVIVWQLNLELPTHAVPITTDVVNSNPALYEK